MSISVVFRRLLTWILSRAEEGSSWVVAGLGCRVVGGELGDTSRNPKCTEEEDLDSPV